MIGNTIDTIKEADRITHSVICGLWEVIRILHKGEPQASYPWIKARFKFNFLEDNTFLCMRDGQTTHGTWEFSEKSTNNQRRISIILNGVFEYHVIDFSDDELTLSDFRNDYLFVRKL
jgi:hypothetical protein